MDCAQSSGNNASLWPGLVPQNEAEAAYLENCLTPERLNKLRAVLAGRGGDIIPVLYHFFDAYNTSGILRTAESFGLQNVAIIEAKQQKKFPKAVTRGCEKWLTISNYATYAECAAALRKRGYRIVAADMDGVPLNTFDPPFPIALVAGAEHDGISAEIRRDADAIISIPMCGFSQSMNVSVATGIILSALLAKRDFCCQNKLSAEEQWAIRQKWLMQAVPHAKEVLMRYRADHGT